MKTPATLAAAAVLAVVAIMADTQVQETHVREETQAQETHAPMDEYRAVWDWCGVRFPFREDLQEACRWGAHEMLPGQEAPADERTQDA